MSRKPGTTKMCVVTTNRSDWSKLLPVATELATFSDVKVDIIALGSQMLHELGETINVVRDDFPEVFALHTLIAGNSAASMTDSVGFGIVKVAALLTIIKPDVVIIHGEVAAETWKTLRVTSQKLLQRSPRPTFQTA